jgi:hypothetical protein
VGYVASSIIVQLPEVPRLISTTQEVIICHLPIVTVAVTQVEKIRVIAPAGVLLASTQVLVMLKMSLCSIITLSTLLRLLPHETLPPMLMTNHLLHHSLRMSYWSTLQSSNPVTTQGFLHPVTMKSNYCVLSMAPTLMRLRLKQLTLQLTATGPKT